jgi:prepilin peptidase dependent protein B
MRDPLTRTRQFGLSIVETMVGLAVGLFIVGGALKIFVDNLDSNRRLLLETRVNQDLRAAADLIARDLRRASYWQNSTAGVWQSPASAPAPNPYATIDTSVPSSITFSHDNAAAGFQLTGGAIQIRVGGAWQPLTDPSTMTVDEFSVVPVIREVCLLSRCANPCPAGVSPCPPIPDCPPNSTTYPLLKIRQYQILIRGHANVDTRVVRQIDEIVRVRNDELTGSCPSP